MKIKLIIILQNVINFKINLNYQQPKTCIMKFYTCKTMKLVNNIKQNTNNNIEMTYANMDS